MVHPYRDLIEQEANRAEADLIAFRSRALTVVTTSAGIVTLMTGLITFGASKAEQEKGVPDAVIFFLVLAFVAFLAAATLALWSNTAKDVDRPSGKQLLELSEEPGWSEFNAEPLREEKRVAHVLAVYVKSLRKVADKTAERLNLAIGCQILGLLLTALAGVIAVVTLN